MWITRIAVVLLLLTHGPACAKRIDNGIHVAGVREVLSTTPHWVERTALGKKLWAIERAFYEARGYLPAWVDGDRNTTQLKRLVQELRYSENHGLHPARYSVDEFERILQESKTRMGTRFGVDRVPELDARLTHAYLQYAGDLVGWGTTPSAVSRYWIASAKKEDLAARLQAAITQKKIRESLEQLAPAHPQYKGLQAALAREKEQPTGQADLIRMNLERWRWTPRDLGARHVLINVPAYMLQVVEGETPVLSMRIIVGKPDTPTPLFSDEMTYVVFSPYWNIPENILREETLPRVASNPDFLRRNNIEVVGTSGTMDPTFIDWSDESATSELRFRQRPGPDNALGLVKFIFPNHFDVYLHDTPTDRLFFKDRRPFSHGCLRIENPVGLANYVLREQSAWTPARIAEAMHARREQVVKLRAPLPVHIGYWTAWVEPDRTVTVIDDPYGLDRAHARVRSTFATRPPTRQPDGQTRVGRSRDAHGVQSAT